MPSYGIERLLIPPLVLHRLFLFFLLNTLAAQGQIVSLYDQFYGFYDYTIIGNTLNSFENHASMPCSILTSASATLNLPPSTTVEKAYLYWAGSGSGDFDVTFNGTNITAQRTFSLLQTSSQLTYFSAFYDATAIVQQHGNGIYNLSDFDLTSVIGPYCPFGGNFAGWALVIVYGDPNVPSNQINIYDGFQHMPSQIDFTLTNFDLDIISNNNAAISFVAWEGDKDLHNNESVRINGNLVGSPPLNPLDNAFNGTNSFTGSSTLYNMDIDVYSLANFVDVGDTSADIQLNSNQDFVAVSTVVTRFNSRYTDATIAITNTQQSCDSRIVSFDYVVTNASPTEDLPANTSLAVYVNNQLHATPPVGQTIPPLGTRSQTLTIDFASLAGQNFNIKIVVDDNGAGQGIIDETNENNNQSTATVNLWTSPAFNVPANLNQCTGTSGGAVFDFSGYAATVSMENNAVVTFHENASDAQEGLSPISNTANYSLSGGTKSIFVRIANANCAAVTSFDLISDNCTPVIPDVVSPNDDHFNDSFIIEGLAERFLQFKIEIYNRWGRKIWQGDRFSENWRGQSNVAAVAGKRDLPAGTYFYALDLQDPTYPNALNGWVYLMR